MTHPGRLFATERHPWSFAATMERPDIGVDVGDFRLAPKGALRLAADLSFRVIEIPTVSGDLAPRKLSSSGRRHLARLVDGLGLHMAALRGDMAGIRLTDPRTVDQRIARTCEVIELARDLGVGVVTASTGALTHPETGEPSSHAIDALRRIGEFADACGVSYAIRPTRDAGDRMVKVLDELACPAITVCLDPAELLMNGANPLSGIDRYVEQISLMHARDGTAGRADGAGRETPLGEGDVDMVGLLAALSAADYPGPYILRSADSQDPVADIQRARGTLTGWLPPG